MSGARFEHTNSFVDKFQGVTSRGDYKWQAKCPCRNDDSNPSVSITEEQDGTVLVYCHRGLCSFDDICNSVNVKPTELLPPSKRDDFAKKEEPQSLEHLKPKLVETYDYLDEDGNLLFQKMRMLQVNGSKTFRQRRPTESGDWDYSLGDTPKVLYNLPEVIKAKKNNIPIWIVEGEKDANTLISKGQVATTAPNGAGHWLDIHTSALSGAQIEIVADNDEPGIAHAVKVYAELKKAGCDVGGIWLAKEGKDVTDHINAGLTLDDLDELPESMFPKQKEEPKALKEKGIAEKALDVVSELEELVMRADLNVLQKLTKAGNIVNSFNVGTPLDSGRSVSWDDLISESDDDSYDWLIENLLERGERVIVVAAEGVGKTMLARQVAILTAHGIHPFTFQRIKPVRTLMVDLENPEKIIRRSARKIVKRAKERSFTNDPVYDIFIKPSGLDLLKMEDRMLLEEQIQKTNPELVVLGPLYKSFVDPGGRTSESVAIEVAKYLDSIRTVYDCALWLEHHAPLGNSMSSRDLRPFGSAVWSRWPEFGISLQPDITSAIPDVYDIGHFRGARDERSWPTKIKRGKLFPFEIVS
jgi:hypothetical protein